MNENENKSSGIAKENTFKTKTMQSCERQFLTARNDLDKVLKFNLRQLRWKNMTSQKNVMADT